MGKARKIVRRTGSALAFVGFGGGCGIGLGSVFNQGFFKVVEVPVEIGISVAFVGLVMMVLARPKKAAA